MLASWILVALLACSVVPDAVPEAQPVPEVVGVERRRVVVIVISGLRRDRVGIYGGSLTPTLDQFAKHATVFDQARSVSPATLPALRSVVSGRFPDAWSPHEHLGLELQSEGYEVALFTEGSSLALGDVWTLRELEDASAPGVLEQALQQLARPGNQFLLIQLTGLEALATDMAAIERYDDAVRTVDASLAPLLDALSDPADVIVVLSDHGEELGDHGAFGHGRSLYDEAIHVPLLLRGRGVAPGRRMDGVSLVDIAPTLRAMLGHRAQPGSGRALLMFGPPRRVGFGFVEVGTPAFGFWSPGEKWITRDGKSMAFDLRADPKELSPIPTPREQTSARRAQLSEAFGRTPSELDALGLP